MARPSKLTPLMRVWAVNGMNSASMLGDLASAQTVLLFGEHDDAAAFGRFVGKAGKLGGVGQVGFVDAVGRDEFDGLAVAERDGAGFVEQQRVDVARGFHRFAAHGENVVLHHAVHAGDADGGEQAADGGRDQADEQRDEHDDAWGRSPLWRRRRCTARTARE